MNHADFVALYRYNDWANERMLAAIELLTADQFVRPPGENSSSIRDLLAHLAGADWLWLERWRGGSPSERPEWTASTESAVLSRELRAVAARRSEFLAELNDGALARKLTFRYLSGDPGANVLADSLFHVANHSTYHRGQLALKLRQVGAVPPETDYDVFARLR